MKKIFLAEAVPLIIFSVIIDLIELTAVGGLFTSIPSIILFIIIREYLNIKGAKKNYLFWLSFFDYFPIINILPLKTTALVISITFHNHAAAKFNPAS